MHVSHTDLSVLRWCGHWCHVGLAKPEVTVPRTPFSVWHLSEVGRRELLGYEATGFLSAGFFFSPDAGLMQKCWGSSLSSLTSPPHLILPPAYTVPANHSDPDLCWGLAVNPEEAAAP